MSSYCKPADLTSLSIPAASLASLPSDQIQLALDAASDIVDSYLGSRFVLPLVGAISPGLKQIVCDIAAYRQLIVRGVDPDARDVESLKDNYDQAISWLKDVRDGQVKPVLQDSSQPGAPEGGPTAQQAFLDGTSQAGVPGQRRIASSGSVFLGPPRLRGWNSR